jgi:YidC/Oxa1 family membrane protein insertase
MQAGSTPYREASLDRNLILAIALSMAVFSGWLAWQESVQAPQRQAAMERAKAEAEAREAEQELGAETPSAAEAVAEPEAAVAPAQPAETASPAGITAGDTARVAPWLGRIETELVSGELSNRGGTLRSWTLKKFFETPRQEVMLELLGHPEPWTGVLETPFEELGLGNLAQENFEVEHEDAESVTFLLRRGGVEIRKIYRALEAPYQFQLELQVTNDTDSVITPHFAVHWPVVASDRPDFKELGLTGRADDEVTIELLPSVGSGGFFSGVTGGDDEGPTVLDDIEWSGMDTRYFTGLLIPEDDQWAESTFEPLKESKVARAVIAQRPTDIAPGSSVTRRYTAFFGPKQPALLAEAGHNLDRTISRGWSWVAPLTTFFGWALHSTYRFVPNYGLAIILITVLVRLATWPIMARQMKSAEKMRELMPRIKELQEKYKDDRQKQSEETFKLYRETGVNPLGGCLPMVLQLPVFIGLFYALQSSIDLRHAPFFLWINDLSAPATLFTLPGVDFPVRLLPLLMGASMFAQQKMMPQTGMDPAQAKMMLWMMPGMMLFISYGFPSGLVLYWMVSNLLGIGHQLLVRRSMQQAQAA